MALSHDEALLLAFAPSCARTRRPHVLRRDRQKKAGRERTEIDSEKREET